MEYTRMGRTGLWVSRLCMGTMNFGSQCDEQQSNAILNRALEAGISFLDSADGYPFGVEETGTTEEIIGRWMKGRRQDVIISTKGFAPQSDRRWDRGASRKHLLDAVEGSLRRLQTDYIDVYQIHMYDADTPEDESQRAMEDLVRSGKVRYIGVSNWQAYQVARSNGKADASGLTRYDLLQCRYNLLFRGLERDLFKYAAEEGLGVINFSPLAEGLLTGKHQRDTYTEGTRFTLGLGAQGSRARYWRDQTFDTVEQIRELSNQSGLSMAHLAIGWTLANPVITAPIIGASRPEQLEDAIRAVEHPLPADVKERLDEITVEYRYGDSPW